MGLRHAAVLCLFAGANRIYGFGAGVPGCTGAALCGGPFGGRGWPGIMAAHSRILRRRAATKLGPAVSAQIAGGRCDRPGAGVASGLPVAGLRVPWPCGGS
ncbi:unnamed protein product, partial [Effrenium voratum]